MCTSEKTPGAIFPAERPLYYYITDRHQLPVGSIHALLMHVERAISRKVDFIQLREKDLTDRQLLKLTQDAVRLARGSACRILVNGRLDIALAGGAHGVHLPSTGIGPADLKAYLPRSFILGVSTHTLREARHAAAGGADYILLGPVFLTSSKIQFGMPLGLARFKKICASVSVPVLGLGGIRVESVSSTLAAGASGIAGISLFQRDLSQFLHLRSQ